MSRPLVSVVTPVYNTAEYLGQCIESVLAQTYADFEYIVLDNRSTDGSADIAKTYAQQDSRMRVIEAEDHVGQVENYNRVLAGISTQSRYCKMVQADDFLMPECIEEMVKLAESDPDIALVGSYQLASDHIKGAGVRCTSPVELCMVVPGREICRAYLLDDLYLFGTPTSLLYRSEDVRRSPYFFQKSGYHEDSEICFELLVDRKFGFIHQLLTYSRTDNESLSTVVQDLQPDVLHRHIILRKFGRRYLDEKEYEALDDFCMRKTLSVIVQSYGKSNGSVTRKYYRQGLQEAGIAIPAGRLAAAHALRVLRLLGNPWNTVESAIGSVIRRNGKEKH